VSYEDVARLLLPADGRGTVARAGNDWKRPDVAPGEPGVVWGREPTWEPAGPRLARYALRRERALLGLRVRPPAGLSVVGVHRWALRFYRPQMAAHVMWRLREGVLVELAGDRAEPRLVDVAARAADVPARLAAFHIGAGGTVCARGRLRSGEPVMLRVARAGSAGDPAQASGALERLGAAGAQFVPGLLGHGREGEAAWSTERLLPGHPPSELTSAVVGAAAAFCAALPQSREPPRAFAEDIAGLAERLPRLAGDLRAVERAAGGPLAGLPSVLGHGDLWLSNLLFEHGRLTGVVDWDAWHPSAVPGTDLLHLVAAARAFAAFKTFAELLADRPWQDNLFAAAGRDYWPALGVAPGDEELEAVAVAWWAAQTHSRLRRQPTDAADPLWVSRNVEPVLRQFV
jgi:hypothetical protein